MSTDAAYRATPGDANPADQHPAEEPWFLFAFDHRDSFRRMLGSPAHADVVAAKRALFDGFVEWHATAIDHRGAAILIDEEYGSGIVADAGRLGVRVVMPVERSGQRELGFEYGGAYREHIERSDPAAVKVLLRWDPLEGVDGVNARQAVRLAELSAWMRSVGRTLIVEFLIPPSDDSSERADRMASAVVQIRASGTDPQWWKVEGVDEVDHARRVADAIAAGGSTARAVVLGRGVEMERAAHWLACAAQVARFDGFAIGKTLWQEPMRRWLAGTTSRPAAVDEIAHRYGRLVTTWKTVRAGGLEPPLLAEREPKSRVSAIPPRPRGTGSG